MATKSAAANTMSPASQLFSTSKAKQFADFSKPHKNEAFVRLRNSTLCLVTLVLLTYLLPVPSLWTALHVVRREAGVTVLWAVCAAEVALSSLLALDLIQAAVAIKYPRTPLPPLPSSPAKGLLTPQGQKKRRTVLSPGVSMPSSFSLWVWMWMLTSCVVTSIDEPANATFLQFIVRPLARIDTLSDVAVFHA
ncbi:hypothetical protein J3R82DRAFT_2745 [Butyriboletus roseoflavus]|nr:hypothetical protein J3R82DRAFT_2745 [Butyriboletus roseoflavus]